MNWTRGLFRVWVIASVVWVGGWTAYVLTTCNRVHVPGSPEGTLTKVCYTGLSGWQSQVPSFTFADYASLVATGLGIPLIVLGLGAGVAWIAKGFRPN